MLSADLADVTDSSNERKHGVKVCFCVLDGKYCYCVCVPFAESAQVMVSGFSSWQRKEQNKCADDKVVYLLVMNKSEEDVLHLLISEEVCLDLCV